MTLQVCTPRDVEEMVHLLADVFPRYDPPAIAAGITLSDFEALVRLYAPRAGQDGLTIVARSDETDEMIGVLLTEDSASEPPPGLDQLSPRFHPVLDILRRLDPPETPKPGESLHLWLLGVSPKFAGQGVAQQLVSACPVNGAGKGYFQAVAEATNLTSQHIFRKQGFIERFRVSYRDHRFQGRAVFESIAEQGGPARIEKLLLKESPRVG